MRMQFVAFVFCLLVALPLAAQDVLVRDDGEIKQRMDEAIRAEISGSYLDALTRVELAASFLTKLQSSFPQWEPAFVSQRLKECQGKIEELQPKAAAELTVLNEWNGADDVGSGDWAAMYKAQVKVTFLELKKAAHPQLGEAEYGWRLKRARKALDDLEVANLGRVTPAKAGTPAQ